MQFLPPLTPLRSHRTSSKCYQPNQGHSLLRSKSHLELPDKLALTEGDTGSPRGSECSALSEFSESRSPTTPKTPKHVSFSKHMSFKTVDGKIHRGLMKKRDGWCHPLGIWYAHPNAWADDEGDDDSSHGYTRTSERPGKECLTPPLSKTCRMRYHRLTELDQTLAPDDFYA